MGMCITTSDGTLDSQGFVEWIFDPDDTDGDATGLCWSAGAGSVCDALRAIGLEPIDGGYSDAAWPLTEVAPKLAAAQAALDPDDDYLIPRLEKVAMVIANGQKLGATHLTAS